jgi:hypothetical protein
MAIAVARRRRADLALREGRSTQAETLARAAYADFAALGEIPAQAGSLRVVADACILRGEVAAARDLLHAAVGLHVRAQDLRGLARTLTRLAYLEDAAGRGDVARERRAQADEVMAALGES